MKFVLALAIAVILLTVMTPIALAADSSGSGITVYVSVSVDGQLLVAAQPVTITDMTAQGAIKAAHAAYYPDGESGYTAGIDPMFNMYLITRCWGITATPFVIINGAPLGADPSVPLTVDAAPVAANDNIIICTSSDPMNRPAQPVSLASTLSGDSATVTAIAWTLDFMTFTYSSAPLASANAVDPTTGASLGITDAGGRITVTVPESGIVAIEGLAAINVKTAPASAPAAPASPPTGPTTVYVSVSVDGQLLVAAQPVTITDMTAQGAIKAAHAAYYSGGESGYTAGIDPMFNMYLITQCWGITATPFVIINGAPLGADPSVPLTVDAAPVAANNNIIICTSSDPMNKPAQPVSLASTLSGDSATVTAIAWTLDFMTFMYSSAPLANANVIDPTTGASLGTTDADGRITVTVPESGVVAIEGLAAINVKAIPAPPSAGTTTPGAGNVISYKDAKQYIGKTVTIQAQVFEKVDADTQWVLFLGGPSTDPNAVGIEVNKSDVSKFPADLYVGKTISITGELHANPVGGASFSLTDPSQIQVGGVSTPAAPAANDIPLLYVNTISLIIVAVVILTPIAVIVIVKMVRQSRLDKVNVQAAAAVSPSAALTSAFAAPTSAAGGSGATVYVSVSVDGKLLVAAQPVTITDRTVQGAIKAAHAKYYSGGESGYSAGIDPTFNMFLITRCWGIKATPFVIVNDKPLGAGQTIPPTVDTAPVAANDNIIICTSSDMMNRPATPVSLTATLSGGSATVTATAWTLNMSTFTYTSAPLANADVVDPIRGAFLGNTDAEGRITVTVPESGVVSIKGLAAIAAASQNKQSKGKV